MLKLLEHQSPALACLWKQKFSSPLPLRCGPKLELHIMQQPTCFWMDTLLEDNTVVCLLRVSNWVHLPKQAWRLAMFLSWLQLG